MYEYATVRTAWARDGSSLEILGSGLEGDSRAGPVACSKPGVLGYPGDADGRCSGGPGVAPTVVLIDGLRTTLIFSVKGVGVEEPARPGKSCACVVVPD